MSEMSRKGAVTLVLGLAAALCAVPPCRSQQLTNGSMAVTVQAQDGSFQLASRATPNRPVLSARPGAQIDQQWVHANDYPQRRAASSTFNDALGTGHQISVTCSGLQGKPDLVYTLQVYDQSPYAAILVELQNHSGKAVTVQAIRSVEAIGQPVIGIPGPESADRILSDSYSEDWPRLVLYDLGSGPHQMHRGAWSQVIYNRESKQSLFMGALSANRFLTLLHLMYQGSGNNAKIASYTVDATGTTEVQKEVALSQAPPGDVIDLSLTLPAAQNMASERVMMATGGDYLAQMRDYGDAVRRVQHARIPGPNMLGWWSWTAYYMAISEGSVLANALWEAENLKQLGYDYVHIDEGYQYARGEYSTPNAKLFPHGMRLVEDQVRELGLTPGIWTAPFEVTNRSLVYQDHKDWLVHNASGTPISVGTEHGDILYAIDPTNPGAQQYMTQTYHTLTREWGIRYIKLDFMDTASVEGYHYRPNTSALEANRIGLEVIRKAVGDDVLLDKDGSPMLPPVGIVDTGRISADTAHDFPTTKAVLPGLAARFYMNRNWFLADPDAYNVEAQVALQRTENTTTPLAGEAAPSRRQAHPPLTLSEAETSIASAAITGGMYEIGDDLPILGTEADRLALVKNLDLLNMAKISRASTPLDLLSYAAEDEEPSVFFLREDARQSILTVFNWTDRARSHSFKLVDLGLPANRTFQASDALHSNKGVSLQTGTVRLDNMEPHSVRVIKLIDSGSPAAAPSITAQVPKDARVVQVVAFSASAQESGVPALAYHWDFGDGTRANGAHAHHAYTHEADYTVRLTADGLDGVPAHQTFTIKVSGTLDSGTDASGNTRYTEP
jgi:alpha-galactosidase